MRVVHLASHMGYAELLQSARAKFPGAPPFVVKYLDRRGRLRPARLQCPGSEKVICASHLCPVRSLAGTRGSARLTESCQAGL